MAQKSVRVLAGTGRAELQQVNITGASGPWPEWVQMVAGQYATGPTGSIQEVQAFNTGPSGGQSIKTVRIVNYLGPS